LATIGDPWRPLATCLKMANFPQFPHWGRERELFLGYVNTEKPKIFHSILIFVPNILGGRGIRNTEIKKYSCCLSALRPRFKSEGGKGEKPISGMCVQPNIFHSILIFVPTHLEVDLKYRNT